MNGNWVFLRKYFENYNFSSSYLLEVSLVDGEGGSGGKKGGENGELHLDCLDRKVDKRIL